MDIRRALTGDADGPWLSLSRLPVTAGVVSDLSVMPDGVFLASARSFSCSSRSRSDRGAWTERIAFE
jgi:hypothetical protein